MTSKRAVHVEKALSATGIAYEVIHQAKSGLPAQRHVGELNASGENPEEDGRGPVEGDSIDPAALARANAVLAALSESYPQMVQPEVDHLTTSWKEIRDRAQNASIRTSAADNIDQRDEDRIYRIAHDFKGHAGSYGYPLVSIIAASLCSLIKGGGLKIANTHDVIDRHINAIRELIRERLGGDGGERGQQIVEDLRRRLTSPT
jgi:hypothetical protein